MRIGHYRYPKTIRKWLIIACSLLVFVQVPQAQSQESIEQEGVIYTAPKGYMKAAFATVKGALFLHPKNAGGIFVVYPSGDEAIAALRKRVLVDIAAMFFHDKDVAAPLWQVNPFPAHAGDVDAELASSTDGDMEVRVATYQRLENGRLIVYGYFAMQHKSRHDDDGKFLDEQGKGVKEFDNVWKSFGEKR